MTVPLFSHTSANSLISIGIFKVLASPSPDCQLGRRPLQNRHSDTNVPHWSPYFFYSSVVAVTTSCIVISIFGLVLFLCCVFDYKVLHHCQAAIMVKKKLENRGEGEEEMPKVKKRHQVCELSINLYM